MSVLSVIEICVIIIVVAFIVTQIAIPGLLGHPLFPWFRRERKLDAKLGEAREQVRLATGEKEIERTLRKAGVDREPTDSKK